MIPTIGLSIKALKKEPFSGSHCGMRYYLNAKDDMLYAYIYSEPLCFEATPDDQKEQKDFPFTQDGLNAAVDWLNAIYEERRVQFNKAEKDKMKHFLGR